MKHSSPSVPAQTARPGRAWSTLGARQGTLRELNLGLALSCVLASDEPVSRADIAAETGLTRATVSALVDLLVEAGLVAELDPLPTHRAGRPAVRLVPASRTIAGIGLEVNIDYLGIRAIDLAGDVVGEAIEEGNFRRTRPEDVLGQLTRTAAPVLANLEREGVRIIGACLALPGLVDRGAGPLRLAPNLGWQDADLVAQLDHPVLRRVGVRLANEANLAARAEIEALRGEGLSFIYVSGEVGIGGALVHDGDVFVGEHGWSGEIGHTMIDPHGPACLCGSQGCLERYAGKDAIFEAAGLDRLRPVDDLLAAVGEGDSLARAAVERAGWALGIALANFVNLTDVNTIVLGGIYAPLAELLLGPVERELGKRVLFARWSQVEVRTASAGPHAAMTGAAHAVLGMVVSDPSAWSAVPSLQES